MHNDQKLKQDKKNEKKREDLLKHKDKEMRRKLMFAKEKRDRAKERFDAEEKH